MAGYQGYSKSNNAVDAESDGRYPMTQAVKVVRAATGVTIKEARAMLKEIGTCEWHHTSAKYNATDYYDTEAAIEYFSSEEYKTSRSLKDRFEAARAELERRGIKWISGVNPDGSIVEKWITVGTAIELGAREHVIEGMEYTLNK